MTNTILQRSPMKLGRAFTLIELLITCSVIAIALSVCCLSVPRLIQGEKLDTEGLQLVNLIELAESICANQQEDVVIAFEPQPSGIYCQLRSSSLQKKMCFKHIDYFSVNGQAGPSALYFHGSLSRPPQAQICIGFKRQIAYVHLPGYLGATTYCHQPQSNKNYESHYPEKILSVT